MNSKFIVIEGMDGAGTTTQTNLLKERLTQEGYSIESTKEPFQGEICSLISKILSGQKEYQQYRESMTWLYMADREYHIRTCIKPALDNGKFVVSDRYLPSTMAYQSEGQKLSLCQLYLLHKYSNFIVPYLTVYIKTPVDVCLDRLKSRKYQDIFEKEDFLKKLSKRYDATIEILMENGWNILTLDGTKPIENLTNEIIKKIIS